MGFLSGKRILVTGVLSNRSIAYGIARACHREGAELAFTYVGERFKDRIIVFSAELDSKMIFQCDVGSDDEIAAGTVTVKDLDLGRDLARDLSDNAAWKAERPGQATIPRAEMVAFVKRIVG